MKTIAIDARLLGRGAHSGIQEYAVNIIEGIIAATPNDKINIFYNGLNLNDLPQEWQSPKNVEIVNWRIPNKILNASLAVFNRPQIDALINADVFFSPHIDLISLGNTARVMTFHDLSFVHHPNFFPAKIRLWHAMQHYKKSALLAVKIITVSEFTKNDLIKLLGISPEKISVIYSGIEKQFRRLDARDPRLLWFKNNHALNFPFVLYLGTLEPRKNVPALIRAWNIVKQDKNFSDLRLVLAGAPGWLYKDIMLEARKARFSDQIIFWGPVKTEERVLLYNLSSIFVYPSFFEGFGFPPLEAQACGVPVIAANRASLPETLKDSAVLIDPWRVAELAEAMQACLTNNILRKQLVTTGLRNSERFSWQDAANKTLRILYDASK